FFNDFDAGEAFDDIFTFTIPQTGTGSGSISTSFSSDLNKIVITDLIINGTAYSLTNSASGQSATVGGIPISAFVLNTIEVKGFAIGSGGYSGTATFTALPVPETTTWAMMAAGLGVLGLAMRRRKVAVSFA
ncbi:MAG: PEP-CTERM sorting domain-containing protein, partial [Sphingobium sp.]|nr:PEP-CTERM sorting domain-containing protein [Sphingobium sp.]